MRAKGQCVIDGANDNEVDDDEDDDHDDDDDENYEDDDNDGADEDDVVVFVLVCVRKVYPTTLRPNYPGGTPAPQPRVIHTPQPRIERDGPTADYPLSGKGITNAGTSLSTRAFSVSTKTDNASVCPAKRSCKTFCTISAKNPAHLSL